MMSLVQAWESEYAQEIYIHLLNREQHRKEFAERSPNIRKRDQLIAKLSQLCLQHNLSLTVKYLAIYILDFFMDNHRISGRDSLHLTLICSIGIAAKVDENDMNIPKITKLMRGPNQFTICEVMDMEKKILQFFKWDFLVPTPATYLDYLCAKSFDENKLLWKNIAAQHGLTLDRFLTQFETEMIDHLERTIDVKYYKFHPSQVVSSCLYCVRSKYLTPAWSEKMQSLTTYSVDILNDCVQMLMDDIREHSLSLDMNGNEYECVNVDINPKRNKLRRTQMVFIIE